MLASYGSLANKHILAISGWWLIKLNNEFIFPDPEPSFVDNLCNDQDFAANLDYISLYVLL